MAEEDMDMQQEAPQTEPETAPVEPKEASHEAKKTKKDKKNDALAAQITELTDKLSRQKDDYLRLLAEFETFRRRSSEERLALVATAAADTIKGLLPVLDDCERAMKMLESSSDDAAREGTSLIYNKLMDYLKTRGLSVIEANGADFDTDYHEAVTQFPAPSEELKGKVLDVVQTGYMLNGKVLRYAKVVVGA